MADQCGVHCSFHHITKWKMAHVHHIFARGNQISVVQILDKDAYKDLTGAWRDEVFHPQHKKKHLDNKHCPAMLKSVFDMLKLHEFPRKIILCSVHLVCFSNDEYWRCGGRSDLVKANTKAAQTKKKDPAAVWGTAYSTTFEFPTADTIISKTGLRVRLPEGICLTEDTMINLSEELQQKHSNEGMRIATNKVDAKRKVA